MLWLLGLFLAYWILLEVLSKRRILEKYGMKNYGPILMIRTTKGLSVVEKISKAKKFWRLVADLGTPAVFGGMFFMLLLVVVADYVMLVSPPQPSELTSPQAALLIPGVNPFIPLVGLIGLIVAIVVHEFGHAILCRVEGIKVKSLGLILAFVPIGAFAEPDEGELLDKKTRRISRIRVFSIGVISNLIVALIAFSAFFYSLNFLNPAISVVDDSGNFVGRLVELNGYEPKELSEIPSLIKPENTAVLENESGRFSITFPGIMGVKITGLYKEENKTFPAELAGIKEGVMITEIDGVKIYNVMDFNREMQKKKPGQSVEVEIYDPKTKEFKVVNMTLADKNGRGFMGVYVGLTECIGGLNFYNSKERVERLKGIPASLKDPMGWLVLISLPFEFRGGFLGVENLFNNPPYVFWLLDSLFWIAWINLWVGLFNCLPAIPLDGGRVFHETFSAILSRRFGERAERLSMNISKLFAVFIFLSLALMILVPNLELLGL